MTYLTVSINPPKNRKMWFSSRWENTSWYWNWILVGGVKSQADGCFSKHVISHTYFIIICPISLSEKKDNVLKYNPWLSVFRYIQLVRRLLCEHGWLSIGCQPDSVTVCWVNCPITAEGCLWEGLELGLQHSSHPALKPQRLLLLLTALQTHKVIVSDFDTAHFDFSSEVRNVWKLISCNVETFELKISNRQPLSRVFARLLRFNATLLFHQKKERIQTVF